MQWLAGILVTLVVVQAASASLDSTCLASLHKAIASRSDLDVVAPTAGSLAVVAAIVFQANGDLVNYLFQTGIDIQTALQTISGFGFITDIYLTITTYLLSISN